MSDKKNFDFNKLIDSFIHSAKNMSDNIAEKGGEFVKESGIKDLKDYYSFYSWPPLNLYVSESNGLVFEFGLPGFVKDDVSISFKDDNLIFSAKISAEVGEKREVSYKSKLKLTDINEQKYFLPLDRYDRKNYKMHMKNGLLRLVFNPLEEE